MSITEVAASVAARAFFYPSLAWNIARNRLQETWHWWDEITENVILGALPFYSTLEQMKEMGVKAVVTLNEEFEVFITPEQYQDSGFAHLHIPTVDFLYAPPTEDLHRGADFIRETAAGGGKTYVHCKAGRGRSTTLVLCYLIKYMKKTPEEAYTFVREKRPQVYLAQGQWTAVCAFYISCHPEKELKEENFPYPTLLPLAPGKQGSDGPEPSQDALASGDCHPLEGDGSQAASITGPAQNGKTDSGLQRQTPSENELQYELSDLQEAVGEETLPEGRRGCQNESRHAVQINASAQPADSDDVVILHGLGSETSSSEVSLGNLATVMSTCCVSPRGHLESKCGNEHLSEASNPAAFQPPERVASPAIEIRRGRSPEPKPLSSANSASKCSISLEPSGSLPGYVRISPMGLRKSPASSSSDTSCTPSVQATLAATGFTSIEDWAAVERSTLER